MNNGLEPREIADIDVANVLANMRHVNDVAAGGKRAAFVEVAIETDNHMARLQQHGNHDRSDVAQVPCYQHTHNYLSIYLNAALRSPTTVSRARFLALRRHRHCSASLRTWNASANPSGARH